MSDRRRCLTAMSTAAIVATFLLSTAAPAQAAVQIAVAPSANGLVMTGVPTTITATGFTGSARVYRLDGNSGRWSTIGVVTSRAPLAYTFPTYGPIRVKVVPTGQRQRTTTVPVYGRFVQTTDPTTFGDVQLPNGLPTSAYATHVTVPASGRCALVDVGLTLRNGTGLPTSGTLLVQSTGAPEARLTVRDGGAVLLAVAVRGAVTVSLVDAVNPDSGNSKAGVVWYCLGPMRMPQVPSS